MTNILEFVDEGKRAEPRTSRENGDLVKKAEIVIFPGVRYEHARDQQSVKCAVSTPGTKA